MPDGYPKHSLTEGVQCWKCYYIKKCLSEEKSLGILDFSQGWEEWWGQTGYTPPPGPNAQCPFKLIYFLNILNRGLYILVRRYQNHFWQCFQMIKSDQALLMNWFGNTILIPLHNQLQGLGRANSIKIRRKTCSVITNPFPNLTGGWIIARCAYLTGFQSMQISMRLHFGNLTGGLVILSRTCRKSRLDWMSCRSWPSPDSFQLPIDTFFSCWLDHKAQLVLTWSSTVNNSHSPRSAAFTLTIDDICTN